MTIPVPSFDDAIVAWKADAEVLGMTQLSTHLRADSNATGKHLASCVRRWGKALREPGPTRIARPPNSSTFWM